MITDFETEQEAFWAGQFGHEYTLRNTGAQLLANNTALFARILQGLTRPDSVLEFGANIGLNLQALRMLLPRAEMAAIEINPTAVKALEHIEGLQVYAQSILEFEATRQWDLVLSKGVLIHIAPEALPRVYQRLYDSSRRYIVLAEYYNPVPVEVPYRGHEGKLFKRDFAGEMLDRYPGLSLRDYGFAYRRGPFPQDDLCWFVLEKPS